MLGALDKLTDAEGSVALAVDGVFGGIPNPSAGLGGIVVIGLGIGLNIFSCLEVASVLTVAVWFEKILTGALYTLV